MSDLLAGRVAIVTGAARGLGRAHALELARHGARVIVNDAGVGLDGSGGDAGPASLVADEITAQGGEAIPVVADVADWESAKGIISAAVAAYGELDILINNAGFLRDRMFVNLSEEDWDSVIRVHLKGHFAMLRHASEYWREQAKAGATRAARVVNTSSGAGLQGSVGQSNYAAAKAGIAAMTIVAAAELGRYGITVNAIAPAARTRMTETAFADAMSAPESGFDAMAPENVSPLVAWLSSVESAHVTGRMFEANGSVISLAEGWRHGLTADAGRRWEAAEIGPAVDRLIADSVPPEAVYGS